MHRLLIAPALLLLLPCIGSCVKESAPTLIDAGGLPKVKLTNAFPGLKFSRPLWIGHDGVNKDVLYVVEQAGRIYRFENKANVAEARLFLDIREKVFSYNSGGHNEEGLLALAFHPKFQDNGHFYVHYSTGTWKKRKGITARFTVSKTDKTVADPASEKLIFEVPQPYGNHKGCSLLFLPDGYLYASFGDGGSQQDPHDNGQKMSTFLSKVLRIDIDKEENGKAYAIPKDNPFIGREGALPEIYAYGFRNPWRLYYDEQTKDLWCGDVGQDTWEWVVIIKKGGNYGWSIKEGSHEFKGGKPADEITPPVIEYNHKYGRSITGGEVYRGSKFDKLKGIYFYCDYQSGRFWGLRYENGKVTQSGELLEPRKADIPSFGHDAANELYATCFDGRIYRVEPAE